MKVLPFFVPISEDKSIVYEHVLLPHFYQHFHCHDEWQITFIERGNGTLIAGGETQPFIDGDLFVIGAKLPHLFKSNPEYFHLDEIHDVSGHTIFFNSEGKLSPLFLLPEMKSTRSFLLKYKHGFKVPSGKTDAIFNLIKKVEQSSGPDLFIAFVNLMLLFQKMDDKLVPICSEIYSTNTSKFEGQRFSSIVNFINKNYNKAFTLEDVAAVAFMTPPSFCRYFKKHTGSTLISYLNGIRVNYACKSLILQGNTSHISSIAYNAGFNSITNFNRVFKKITGKSPKVYIEDYSSFLK